MLSYSSQQNHIDTNNTVVKYERSKINEIYITNKKINAELETLPACDVRVESLII